MKLSDLYLEGPGFKFRPLRLL